jgi:pyruvate,water dikinase
VRSSAPAEDAANASFAGLHESYLNIIGPDAVLKHIRLVWASLWSDRAILYRRELALNAEKSAMAVLIQTLAAGERSGVVFTLSPTRAGEGVVEAVYGLNEGLVDGVVQPDRWTVRRKDDAILTHQPPEYRTAVRPDAGGTRLRELPAEKAEHPPLSGQDVAQVWKMACRAENAFGKPMDVEWTIEGNTLYTLQARPITINAENPDAERSWYLSLTRSFDDLRQLRRTIEQKHIPAMIRDADQMTDVDPDKLDDRQLADELEARTCKTEHWKSVYWNEFIPFAHGIRLFGEVYNDVMQAENPHEFVELLVQTPMFSVRRNALLQTMAECIRNDPDALARVEQNELAEKDAPLAAGLDTFRREFGSMFELTAPGRPFHECLARLLKQMADTPAEGQRKTACGPTPQERETAFIDAFSDDRKEHARDILDLARASYRIRDDDNVYLGRIEAATQRAEATARKRIARRVNREVGFLTAEQLAQALRQPDAELPENTDENRQDAPAADAPARTPRLRARQLVGQPAGPGLATGRATVLLDDSQLFDFPQGDILVCDAVSPNMTFVAPLAKAIVERRGGMLIHGAIIAREYRIPCVTGVPAATQNIRTGDTITVDGHLGIVTVKT